MTRLNCAIYTRKSTEEGLEREFNSLDAQREACEAYITSQKHAGWFPVRDMYDDGGLSGGTMERPALQRLLADIRAGKVQVVVVYKVDRLTRSLADFAKIVDIMDTHDASFVSVTQQFNTTTSMGRLTLNMLLSFAQFEREIAGERIRDKIAASKAKGMWMGGNVPLGYDVKDRKLIVNEAEAEMIRMIFRRYAEIGSIRLLKYALDERGIVSKRRAKAGLVRSGGNRFSSGALYNLLRNPIYHGKIGHQGKVYPGQHEAIIDPDLWQRVQDKLAGSLYAQKIGAAAEEPSLLAGLIVDGDGRRLRSMHAVKKGRRYRYYVSPPLKSAERKATDGWRIPAADFEEIVLDRLRAFFASEQEVEEALASLDLDDVHLRSTRLTATGLAEGWAGLSSIEIRELVQAFVEKVVVSEEGVVASIKRAAVASRLLENCKLPSEGEAGTIELRVEAKLRRAGQGIRLVIGGGVENPSKQMIALLRDAHATREALLTGRDATIDAMARRLCVKRDHLTAFIRLTYLAPHIVCALATRLPPVGLTPARLLSVCKDLPHDWQRQRAVLGFEAR